MQLFVGTKTEDRRTCPSCGNQFSGAMKFCPVCTLRNALTGGVESGESSSQDILKITTEQATQRFEHYELLKGDDGKPLELGRGAMGITYKAFDINLQCQVALKVISERYLGDESARLVFCARHARRRGCGILTLPRYCTWAELGAVTSTRWSL